MGKSRLYLAYLLLQFFNKLAFGFDPAVFFLYPTADLLRKIPGPRASLNLLAMFDLVANPAYRHFGTFYQIFLPSNLFQLPFAPVLMALMLFSRGMLPRLVQ